MGEHWLNGSDVPADMSRGEPMTALSLHFGGVRLVRTRGGDVDVLAGGHGIRLQRADLPDIIDWLNSLPNASPPSGSPG